MAKKKFDNLKPKVQKPTDDKIDDVLASLEMEKEVVASPTVKQSKRQKLIPLHIKLPATYYNALQSEAEQKGLSKKHIVIEALNDRLKDRL